MKNGLKTLNLQNPKSKPYFDIFELGTWIYILTFSFGKFSSLLINCTYNKK